jgi:hypothetical protein
LQHNAGVIQPSEVERLKAAIEAARATQDWRAYTESETELENLYIAQAENLRGLGQFRPAADAYEEVARLNEQLLAVVPRPPVGDDQLDEFLAHNRDAASKLILINRGKGLWSNGQYHIATRNPGLAAEEI